MRTLSLITAAIMALGLSACGPAQEDGPADTPSLDIQFHDGEFATIQQFTTPGGASVWLVEEPSIPIISVRMAWTVGVTSDPEAQEGLTSATLYHMNEGAGDMDAQALFKRMEELNMSFGCGASHENTYCNASMLSEKAADSFDLVALALAEPRFDDGPFERFLREREVSLKQRETNPGYLARRARIEALYPDHPYARETSMESLAALSQDAMRAQQDVLMAKDRLLVTAVGAISPEELAPLIDNAIAALPETSTSIEAKAVTLAAAQADPIAIELPQPQSLVTFAAPAMTRDDPDFYPAVVLNYTFGGGGFQSRLMKDLRVEKGLTYGIGTQVSAGEKLQLWSGSGQTKNESVGEFIAGVKANMTKMVADGMTQQELDDAKAYLTGSYPLGFDSNSKIAENMMGVRLDELPVDFFDTRNARIEAVTLEDVNRVAVDYLSPENFTFIVVGQPEGIGG